MASHGIRDRVAVVGMGCTTFGEHWDKGADDLLVDAVGDALTSAGIEQPAVDAYWVGTMGSGISGLTLSRPLRIDYKPVTRVENMCATGSESFRNACYAVASGAFDVAMATGVEKLKGRSESNGVHDEGVAVPGADEVSEPRWIGVFRMRAPIGQYLAVMFEFLKKNQREGWALNDFELNRNQHRVRYAVR